MGAVAGGGAVKDPISVHHFGLEVQGLEMAMFSECSPIDNETKPIEHYQVNKEGITYKQLVPGNSGWTPVTLKRGLTTDNTIFEWRQKVIDGKIDEARSDATISGYSPDNNIVLQYVLHRAWPSKYQGASFDAKGNSAGMESITLQHEGARRTK
jgi:phage tail-like protein